MKSNMKEEERKRYFGVLIENLYSQLQLISEGTIPNKKEIATKTIADFYKEYKKIYGIENINAVLQELERVDKDMKEIYKEENGER